MLVTSPIDQLSSADIYTKSDLHAGYYSIRIALGHEWNTMFRTCYGSFKFLVMPLSLTKAPTTSMNDVFQDMSDDFMVIYLDDILVHSKSEDIYHDHIRCVLTRLRENYLHIKPEKSHFHTHSMEFLEFMVSPTGIMMDAAKTDTISRLPTPSNIKEAQWFTGFANFDCCFIVIFLENATPLTHSTWKDTKFLWGPKHQTMFNKLRLAFTKAPVLLHLDPANLIIIETDPFDYTLEAIISKLSSKDGNLHPITFYPQGMKPTKPSYAIYVKELLAIFRAFQQWHNHLECFTHTILVLLGHKSLKYFTTTKQLTCSQVWWSKYWSGFNYLIQYCAGCLSTKPEALTHQVDVYPQGDNIHVLANPHNYQAMFKPNQLLQAIILDSAVLLISIKQGLAADPIAQVHFHHLWSHQSCPN